MKVNNLLSKLYYNPSSPFAFAGAATLIKAAKQHGIRKKDVMRWLSSQDAYTLHKRVVRKFKRRSYVLLAIDDLWQADLADVSNLASDNDGYKFWLVVIDAFSKFLWVIPIRNKSSQVVQGAFERIVENTRRKPKNLNTDKGKEFVNAVMKNWLESIGVNFYTAENQETKACFAERVIRTIKERMYRYLTYANTKRYIDSLDAIIHSYNNSYHRSIGMKPSEVCAETEDAVRQRLNREVQVIAPGIKVNDSVRITKADSAFRRGYTASWTEEIFQISNVFSTSPPTYKLKDYSGEIIAGKFYQKELQKVHSKGIYKIESVLASRRVRGRNESLVKWQGYPLSMASWIPTKDINPI